MCGIAINLFCTGNAAKRRRVQGEVDVFLEKLTEIESTPLPPRLPKKGFNPANPEIPILEDYRKEPKKEFWDKFPKHRNWRSGTPFKLRVDRLEELVDQAGGTVQLKTLLEDVSDDIKIGADLKVESSYEPTVNKNAPSAYEQGQWVTDEVATAVKKQIVAGPFVKSEVPANATINSIQTAPKPNGKVRIIENMSAPKGKGVNDSIDKKWFPSEMGGMPEILYALNYCGRGAKFAKCDWNAAYKHIAVMLGMLRYQWFMWLSMYFVELCLVFGCVSSVGLYDRLARLMWLIVAALTNYPHFLVIQHLDDLCMVGRGNDGKVEQFYEKYLEVCEYVGVSLQETRDVSEDKAFAPSTVGSMLGIWFDTVKWRWWISEEKVLRYANDFKEMLELKETTQRKIWESVGKVLYISQLIPESRYHTSELLRLNNFSDNGEEIVKLTKKFKRQIKWWIPFVRLAGQGMPIPEPYTNVVPPAAIEADSDAAGGSLRGRPGCGIVMGEAWSVIRWPSYINSSEKCMCGAKWRHKLSFLEMIGHLLHVTVFAEELVDKPIVTNIDNEGTVCIARKGRAMRCPLTDCLVNTINHVAVAIGARAFVRKVRRCSTPQAIAADALSKNDMTRFREMIPDSEKLPRPVPRTVLAWIQSPTVDNDLGRKIVLELEVMGVDIYESMRY